MAENKIPTALHVNAVARQAAQEGVFITVMHRGDPHSGTVILKINLLDGTARVLIEARDGGICIWTPAATGQDPMPDAAAEAYLSRQPDIDPDVWIVEIEDKKGRLWFPGKIVKI